MDILTQEGIRELISEKNENCISIYMPTHQAGKETEQDQIRLKNMLKKAGEDLAARGLRSPDIRDILKPAQQLLQEPFFWKHQSSGLALFFSSDLFKSYRLPLQFEEFVVISGSYHLKPLLPFFANDGHYYILALSQNQIRLLEGTRHTVDEIDLDSMPTSIAETFEFERFFKQVQFHTGTTSANTGDRSGMFHGHDPSDEEKNRILRWFHKIDDELPNVIMSRESPIVLAGVDYLFPLFKEASSYPHIVENGIPGSPEELKQEELHTQAWPLVQPFFKLAQEKATAKYQQLADSGQTTTEVQEAVSAAHHGKVEVLFVALGDQVWGNYDPNSNTVQVHDSKEPESEDLLDLAAIQTLLNGGMVYALDHNKIPGNSTIAAIFRY